MDAHVCSWWWRSEETETRQEAIALLNAGCSPRHRQGWGTVTETCRVQELNPREHCHLVESWERKRKPTREPEKVSSEKMAMMEGSSETRRAQFQEWCCQMLPEQRTLKIKVQRHRTRMFLMTFIRMDKTELGGGRRWMTSTGSEAVETLVCGGDTMKRRLLLNGFKVERQQWHWLHWEYIPVSLMTLCSSFSFLGYRGLLLTLWFDLMYPSLPIPAPQGPQDPRIISVGHESCFKSPWPPVDRISICLRGELSPTAKYFLVLTNVENEVTWGQPLAKKKASRSFQKVDHWQWRLERRIPSMVSSSDAEATRVEQQQGSGSRESRAASPGFEMR